MFLEYESLELEPKETRLVGTMNVLGLDREGHGLDYCLLSYLYGYIEGVVKLV